MRRLLAVGVAGAAAGIALWRRRGGAPAERVDLHFEDGSMVSLPEHSPQAGDLIELGAEAVSIVRGG